MSTQTWGSNQYLDQRFRKALKISAGLHIAIVLIFTVKFYLIPDEIIDYQSSIRVDLVALPEKNLDPVPEPAAPEALPTKPVPKRNTTPKENTVILKPQKKDKANIEKKQQDALNKLKQMSALEKLNESVVEEKPAKQVFAGNQIATGSDLKGLSRLQHDNYIAQVERHIRKNWALPQWLANKKLRTQIRVRIDARGNIVSKDVVRPSGNTSFDDVAVETIERSSPVPAPPEKLARLLANEGILFGFPD